MLLFTTVFLDSWWILPHIITFKTLKSSEGWMCKKLSHYCVHRKLMELMKYSYNQGVQQVPGLKLGQWYLHNRNPLFHWRAVSSFCKIFPLWEFEYLLHWEWFVVTLQHFIRLEQHLFSFSFEIITGYCWEMFIVLSLPIWQFSIYCSHISEWEREQILNSYDNPFFLPKSHNFIIALSSVPNLYTG